MAMWSYGCTDAMFTYKQETTEQYCIIAPDGVVIIVGVHPHLHHCLLTYYKLQNV